MHRVLSVRYSSKNTIHISELIHCRNNPRERCYYYVSFTDEKCNPWLSKLVKVRWQRGFEHCSYPPLPLPLLGEARAAVTVTHPSFS